MLPRLHVESPKRYTGYDKTTGLWWGKARFETYDYERKHIFFPLLG